MTSNQLRSACCLVALLALGLTAGCGTSVYQPAQTAGFELEPVAEISDEDVRKAFEARPQLPSKVSVAYYTFDDDYAEPIEKMLSSLPIVTKTYRIPTLLVTGKRRFDTPTWGMPQSTPPLSIKKLRLMAARARADVLLIFDYGHRIAYTPNGLSAFGVLLLPIFFLPVQDVESESYLDTYVIDTRNGYLYGQVSATREAAEDFLLIYSNRGEDLVDDQRDDLVSEAGRLLAELLSKTATLAGGAAPGEAEAAQGGLAPTHTVPQKAVLRIGFTPDGGLVVNGRPLESMRQARAWLEEFVRGRDASAVIRSHGAVPPRRVVEVVDMLKSLNVRSVAVERGAPAGVDSSTEPAPEPPSGAEPKLPNPASGEPSRVTPAPTLPPYGSPTPVSPLPVGR